MCRVSVAMKDSRAGSSTATSCSYKLHQPETFDGFVSSGSGQAGRIPSLTSRVSAVSGEKLVSNSEQDCRCAAVHRERCRCEANPLFDRFSFACSPPVASLLQRVYGGLHWMETTAAAERIK